MDKSFFQQLGPGLITGASDDDPSGIVTYSKAGAQFGYGMLWTMLFSYPLMSVVQEISARVGWVTGLLAVPVLAGSAAYAVGEALKWPVGLERKPLEAKGFYGVLTVATLLGLAMNFFHIDPIKALVWAVVISGIIAIPIRIVMMFMASDPKVMGKFTLSLPLKILEWMTTLIMLAATIGLLATWGK